MLVIMLLMLALRTSLGAGHHLLVVLQPGHSGIAAQGHGAGEAVPPAVPDQRSTPASHVCCFHFAMAAPPLAAGTAVAPRPAWRPGHVPRPRSFYPELPRKPPKSPAAV